MLGCVLAGDCGDGEHILYTQSSVLQTHKGWTDMKTKATNASAGEKW